MINDKTSKDRGSSAETNVDEKKYENTIYKNYGNFSLAKTPSYPFSFSRILDSV